MNRRNQASERFNERRREEDEAPRLRDVVPQLESCRLEISQGRPGSTSADVSHVRHVMVDVAPAIFRIACCDGSCKEGGHDITNELLRGLRASQPEIDGEDTCYGTLGTATCGRVLRFKARAKYRTAP